MADLFNPIKQIVEFGLKIKSALKKARHNAEGCRRIGDILRRLSSIAEHLQGSPKIMEDDSMRDTVKRLEEALQDASKLVAKCEGKGFLRRAFDADDIAEKLRGVCGDVLLNMNAVLLANVALNTSMLAELNALNTSMLAELNALNTSTLAELKENVAELKENVAQLRADVNKTNSMLAKILQIVDAQPDVHL